MSASKSPTIHFKISGAPPSKSDSNEATPFFGGRMVKKYPRPTPAITIIISSTDKVIFIAFLIIDLSAVDQYKMIHSTILEILYKLDQKLKSFLVGLSEGA